MLALALLATLGPAAARAESLDPEVEIALEYEAPETCPTREDFTAAVRARAPGVRVVAERAGVELVKVAIVDAPKGKVSGSLAFEGDEAAARAIEGAACADVARALSLSLALHLVSREREPEAPSPPSKPVVVAPTRGASSLADEPETPVRSANEVGWSFGLTLGGGARSGVGPMLTPSVSLGGQVRHASGLPVLLVLTVDYSAGRTDRMAFRLVAGSFDACVPSVRPTSWLGLAPCARFEAGSQLAEGASSTASPWVAIGASGRARVDLGRRAFVDAAVVALVPVANARFYEVSGRFREVALEPASIAAFLAISAGLSIW